jgi:hypothetical protein
MQQVTGLLALASANHCFIKSSIHYKCLTNTPSFWIAAAVFQAAGVGSPAVHRSYAMSSIRSTGVNGVAGCFAFFAIGVFVYDCL